MELFLFKGLILCYVNFASIKKKNGPLLLGCLEEPGEFLPTGFGKGLSVLAKRCSSQSCPSKHNQVRRQALPPERGRQSRMLV